MESEPPWPSCTPPSPRPAGNRLDAELELEAAAPASLDIDATQTEAYGRQKQGAAFNHEGRFSCNSQLVTWAERHRVLAVELHSGNPAASPPPPGSWTGPCGGCRVGR